MNKKIMSPYHVQHATLDINSYRNYIQYYHCCGAERGNVKLMKPTNYLEGPKKSMINPELMILVTCTVHDF